MVIRSLIFWTFAGLFTLNSVLAQEIDPVILGVGVNNITNTLDIPENVNQPIEQISHTLIEAGITLQTGKWNGEDIPLLSLYIGGLESNHPNHDTAVYSITSVPNSHHPIREKSQALHSRFNTYYGFDIMLETPNTDSIEAVVYAATAIGLYTANQCKDAQTYFRWFLENTNNPFDTSVANFYLGNCALIEEDYLAAANYFRDSLENIEEAYLDTALAPMTNLAWIYLQMGDQDNGIALIDKMDILVNKEIVHESVTIDTLSRQALLFMQIQNHDQAIQDMNMAIIRAWNGYTYRGSRMADLYILRGQMYLNLYEWDKSLNDFNTAIELAPDYADAYFQRGVLYYSILQTGQELREEALADFRHYLELAPDGEHADQARDYAAKIDAELAALDE